jgi:chaperonin GroEL (HSP60 family)
MDPATIREKQDEDSIWTRVDATDPKITDMSKASNVEPLSVKEQIIKSATEVALMILKTDDVIARGKSKA